MANELEKAGLFTKLNDTVAPSPHWPTHCHVHTFWCRKQQCRTNIGNCHFSENHNDMYDILKMASSKADFSDTNTALYFWGTSISLISLPCPNSKGSFTGDFFIIIKDCSHIWTNLPLFVPLSLSLLPFKSISFPINPSQCLSLSLFASLP